MLVIKKVHKKRFNNAKSLPQDQNWLNMKRLRASFVSYKMLSCIHATYKPLNLLDYGWQMIDGYIFPYDTQVHNFQN